MRLESKISIVETLRFKKQFKQLNYYSMPKSILFVIRKRFNFLCYMAYLVIFFAKSFI